MRAYVFDRSIHGPSAYAEAALEPLRSMRLQFDLTHSRCSESDRLLTSGTRPFKRRDSPHILTGSCVKTRFHT